jgi:hypothetical protein
LGEENRDLWQPGIAGVAQRASPEPSKYITAGPSSFNAKVHLRADKKVIQRRIRLMHKREAQGIGTLLAPGSQRERKS